MDSEKLKELLTELKKELSELYGERFKGLVLFGSYARGDNEEDSDIDVALILDDFADHFSEIERTGDIVSRLCLEHATLISLIPITENDWNRKAFSFIRAVHQDGIPL